MKQSLVFLAGAACLSGFFLFAFRAWPEGVRLALGAVMAALSIAGSLAMYGPILLIDDAEEPLSADEVKRLEATQRSLDPTKIRLA